MDTQKEGLHHIGVLVEDLQGYIDYLQEQGIEIIQTGRFPPSLTYAYLDTEKVFGAVIEFLEIVKRQKRK